LIKRVVLSAQAQTDLAGLDRAVALRIAGAINRLAETGAGSVQGLRGIHAFASVIGEYASTTMLIGSTFSGSAIAAMPAADPSPPRPGNGHVDSGRVTEPVE